MQMSTEYTHKVLSSILKHGKTDLETKKFRN